MSATQIPAIPDLSLVSGIPDELKRFAVAVKLWMEVREAKLPNVSPLDKLVTVRDLGGTSTVQSIATGTIAGSVGPAGPPGPPGTGVVTDYTAPPVVTGLAASAAFSTILVSFVQPSYVKSGTSESNHAYTEIWRADAGSGGSDPGVAAAVRIGQTSGALFADAVGTLGKKVFYWARNVSLANVTGPFNAVGGTTATTGVVGNADLSPLIVDASKLADAAVDIGSSKVTGTITNPSRFGAAVIGYGVIQDGAVNNLMFDRSTGNKIQVVDADMVNVSVSKLLAGSLAVSQYISSTNYVAGVSGFILKADGTAQLPAAYILGQLTASQIDTRGLTVKDASGNIIFGSGASINPSSYMNVPGGWLNSNIAISGGAISGIGAGAGTVVDNGLVPLGNANRVGYSQFEAGAVGWAAGANSLGTTAASVNTIVASDNNLYLIINGNASAAGQVASISQSQRFQVTPSERIACSSIIGYLINVSSWQFSVWWYDAAGNALTASTVCTGSTNTIPATGFVVAPSNAATARIEIYCLASASGYLQLMIRQPMATGATAQQTVFPAFQPGPRTAVVDPGNPITSTNITTYMGGAAIGSAQIGTAQINLAHINTASISRLSALSASVGTLSLNSEPGLTHYINSAGKFWSDANNGFYLAKGADTSSCADFKAGGNRIWLSSWNDSGINFNGQFVVDAAGNVTMNSGTVKTKIMGGAYTSYAWPAVGTNGYYLGPEGLLLGNGTDPSSGYLQYDVASKGLYIGGNVNVSGAIIATGNIQSGAVDTARLGTNAATVPVSASGTYTSPSASTAGFSYTLVSAGVSSTGALTQVTAWAKIASKPNSTYANGGTPATWALKRDGTAIASGSLPLPSGTSGVYSVAQSITTVVGESPAAGSHTYTLEWSVAADANGVYYQTTGQIFVTEFKR